MPKRKRDQDGLYRRGDSPYWWASYINARGKRTRRSTQTTDRKEAEALLAKWRLAAHRERQWDEPPARTFDDLMLAYLRATATTKRSTVRDQCSLKHLYPVFTGQNLYELQQSQVRAYIAQRRSEGAAASTINKEVGLLSSAIGCAQREWGWEVPNPAARCKQREPEGIVRWISRAEAMALIEAAQHDPRSPHLADFIRLGLHTAMRKGEMLGLEWCRVDLQAGLIHLQARHTKTAKRRSIPMNAEARTAIMGRFRFRAQYCPGSPWVFAHADGTRIGDVKRAFVSACRRAGIADFRVHDLRHTCAAWLVSAGVPLVEVRDLLGHKSIAMTERYGHLAPENLRAAVSWIEGGESRSGHVTKTG